MAKSGSKAAGSGGAAGDPLGSPLSPLGWLQKGGGKGCWLLFEDDDDDV